MSFNLFSPCQPCCGPCQTHLCLDYVRYDDNSLSSQVFFKKCNVQDPYCQDWTAEYYTHGSGVTFGFTRDYTVSNPRIAQSVKIYNSSGILILDRGKDWGYGGGCITIPPTGFVKDNLGNYVTPDYFDVYIELDCYTQGSGRYLVDRCGLSSGTMEFSYLCRNSGCFDCDYVIPNYDFNRGYDPVGKLMPATLHMTDRYGTFTMDAPRYNGRDTGFGGRPNGATPCSNAIHLVNTDVIKCCCNTGGSGVNGSGIAPGRIPLTYTMCGCGYDRGVDPTVTPFFILTVSYPVCATYNEHGILVATGLSEWDFDAQTCPASGTPQPCNAFNYNTLSRGGTSDIWFFNCDSVDIDPLLMTFHFTNLPFIGDLTVTATA